MIPAHVGALSEAEVSVPFSGLHLLWCTTGTPSSTDPQANAPYSRLPVCITYVFPTEKAGHSNAGSKDNTSKHSCYTEL